MLLHTEVISHGAPVPEQAVAGIVDEVLLPLLTPRPR